MRRAIGKVVNMEPAELIKLAINMCIGWDHTTHKVNALYINENILTTYPTIMQKYTHEGPDSVIANTYIGTQSRDEWSTETEIKLIASALKRPIIVTDVATDEVRIYDIHKNEPTIITTIALNEITQQRREILLIHPIHLLYDPQRYAEHYNAVILPHDDQGYNPRPVNTAPQAPTPDPAHINSDMESWTNTMEPHTIRLSAVNQSPTPTRDKRQGLMSTIHQKKKQKQTQPIQPTWSTTTYLLTYLLITQGIAV